MTRKYTLATTSPRRIELFTMLKLDFEVIKPTIDENNIKKEKEITEIVKSNASKKAISALRNGARGEFIIGADTIVVLNNQVFEKPKNDNDAFSILSKLSGKTHQVITGVSILEPKLNLWVSDFEKSSVTFRNLTEDEINYYIKTKEGRDKAGAYGIQGIGSIIVKKIDGCYFNVVGFPISLWYDLMIQMAKTLVTL